jgi:hypothetical protein
MYKCPKCKEKIGTNKMDLQNHMIRECNYNYWVAWEICDQQEAKIQLKINKKDISK